MSNVRPPRRYIEVTGFVVDGDDEAESGKVIAIGFMPATDIGIFLTVEEGRLFADVMRKAVGISDEMGFNYGDGLIMTMRPTKTGLVLQIPGESGYLLLASMPLDMVRRLATDVVFVGGSMDHGAAEVDRSIRTT